VTLPDIGYGTAYGGSREEALLQAEDMLDRIENILALLDRADRPEVMDLPVSACIC
jgi:hypothetical protein